MKPAPLPANESERLRSLHSFNVLDTPPEVSYDDITILLSEICETPIALVSLVDAERQWFKSRVGLDAEETPRDLAFCGYTILGDDLFVVSDAREDVRFADNPLVDDPGVRFYAGAPLITSDGHALGSLCAIDKVARTLTTRQRDSLRALSRLVVQQLELRRALHQRDVAERAEAEKSRELSHFFQLSADLLCIGAPDGFFKRLNPACRSILGYSEEELTSTSFMDLIHPEDRDASLAELEKLANGYPTLRFENRFKCRDGSYKWLVWNATPSADSSLFYATGRDVTLRKESDDKLLEAHARLAASNLEMQRRSGEMTTLNEMGELLQSCETGEEACQVVAEYMPRLFSDCGGGLYLRSEARPDLDLTSTWGSPGDLRKSFLPGECWALRRTRPHVGIGHTALTCRHVAGSVSAGSLCAPLVAHGESFGVLHIQIIGEAGKRNGDGPFDRFLPVAVADQVALALANLRLRESLRQQSIRDPLTGLFNRRYMEESLNREIPRATRSRTPVAVMMIDLDHFKKFNDQYGHDAGDTLLRELGAHIVANTRAEDIACRYGGEEFALILPGAPARAAADRAEALRKRVGALTVLHRGEPLPPVTLSIGLAVLPDHCETSEDLLRAADAALYRAKASGRNRVIMATATADKEGPSLPEMTSGITPPLA